MFRLSIGRGFEAFGLSSGGPTSIQQESLHYHLNPPTQIKPDRFGNPSYLLTAAYPKFVQTQAQSSAVAKRIVNVESLVSRLTLALHDIFTKDFQGYNRLKRRVDTLERMVTRDSRKRAVHLDIQVFAKRTTFDVWKLDYPSSPSPAAQHQTHG
ncbi:unnamed protein product [Peronospora belbahrii]|uniref:Uncharacterized protein n=1 Tax=Peronospora belbahrii TaxID=622444 RepID=A0ABN8D4C4_9STRA|nr:unnamed protein product [Peronospora belbahrii]